MGTRGQYAICAAHACVVIMQAIAGLDSNPDAKSRTAACMFDDWGVLKPAVPLSMQHWQQHWTQLLLLLLLSSWP